MYTQKKAGTIMRRHRWMCVSIAFVIFLILGSVTVWGFAEEEVGFRDRDGTYYPPVGDFPNGRISTVHDDLTLALAVAAGFSITDSQTLRIWDQLVDAEMLPSAPMSYTYGNAGFYAPPNPAIACVGKNRARRIWPPEHFDRDTAAVTSRFGPYSPFFHFPHRNGSELRALRDWAWGNTSSLVGYEAYAWGQMTDFTLMQAVEHNGCVITRTVTISMPVPAGSLKAFATYLHTLADAYSHADCMDALGAHTPPAPWGTHTIPALGDESIYACDYNPTHPRDDDAHGREFGSVYTDTWHTIAAARAIYQELTTRSILREGVYVPLPLTTRLTVAGTEMTLDDWLIHFVTEWPYSEPARRREHVDNLLQALRSVPREPIPRTHSAYLCYIVR